MQAKYYFDNGIYGVDFHNDTIRDNAVIQDITREEIEKIVKMSMSEVRELVILVFNK